MEIKGTKSLNRSKIQISVVIPIYDEETVLPYLYQRTTGILGQLKMIYEIIFVNDCSNDNSLEVMTELRKENSRVKIVSFSRNFGHQIAVTAGLHYASGDCVIIMDGDLQDPPEVIVEMIKKWREGFDVVYGIRRNRKEKWLKRTCYRMFYRLLYKISPLEIPLDAGDFCLISRRIVREMRKLKEEKPFLRGLRTWVGFKQAGIEYDRAARKAGVPKYGIGGLFRLAFDGILSFSSVALRAATIIGLIISLLSIIYGVYIGLNRILIAFNFIDVQRLIPGWATLVCSIMLLMGMQFIFIGILGEYIGRIFMQVKGRPLFIVDEEIGFGDDK